MKEFNKKFYTVYNVMTVAEPTEESIYPIAEVYELYSMLIGSKDVVTIEQHNSQDKLRSELRVIFWNEQAYHSWAATHRKRYDEIIHSFHSINGTGAVKFERHTSLDDYSSEFPYTIYPDKTDIIDWTVIPFHKDILIKNILPLGKLQNYIGDGKFSDPTSIKGYGARFIKERSSDIVRRPPSGAATKDGNFPQLLAYSFEQAVQTLMYSAPWLYRKLRELTISAETLASQYVQDCDNAAVLIGHKSLGDEITLHTHRLSDETKYTFTITVRLTFNDAGITFKGYDPMAEEDPNLPLYYSNPVLLYEQVKTTVPTEFKMDSRASILAFSASYIPHLVNYDDDVYLFYVYDNVNFKPGMLDLIKNSSTTTHFTHYPDDKRLYFFDL